MKVYKVAPKLSPHTNPLLIKISTGIPKRSRFLVHDGGDLERLGVRVLSPSARAQPGLDLGRVGAEVEDDLAQSVVEHPLQGIVQQWPAKELVRGEKRSDRNKFRFKT